MKIRGIAHRGYPVKYPENTLTSFQAALDLNYSHVELDVHLSKDGVPVVLHDYSVKRMTGQKGMVYDYTLDELKMFQVGEFERIPTLEETLKLLKGDITIVVELKQAGDLYQDLEKKVLEIMRRTNTFEQCMVISFDHFSIARMRRLDSDVRLGITSSNSMPYDFPFMKEIDGELLGVPLHLMTTNYATMIEEHGIEVGPWPVNTETEMKLIIDKYPSTLITTDNLERWIKFYKASSTS